MAGESDIRAGGAFVELFEDTEGLRRLQSEFNKFAAGMAAIGAGITAVFWKAAGAASDLEERVNKFEAVFKGQSDAMKAWAFAFADMLGLSDREVLGMMASIQDTLVPLGFARDRAAELSQNMVQLAVDLKSFNPEMQTAEEALTLMLSALVGNHEAVRSFGVMITEAALNAQLLAMGIEGGARKASEQEKALARLAIMVGSTSDAHGDALRTSEAWKNSIGRLMSQVDQFWTLLGASVIERGAPYLQWLIQVMSEGNQWMKQNREVIDGLVKLGATLVGVAALVGGVALAMVILWAPIPFAVGGIVAALLVLLDALGIVDTGIRDVANSFELFGLKWLDVTELMTAAWKLALAEMDLWLLQFEESVRQRWNGLLEGMAKIADVVVGKDSAVSEALRGAKEESIAGGIVKKQLDIAVAGIDFALKSAEKKSQFDEGLKAWQEAFAWNRTNQMKPLDMGNLFGVGQTPTPELPTSGIVGFFGGMSAAEQLGGIGQRSVGEDQLKALESIDANVQELVNNSENGGAVYA